jgi:hypothetical protein
MRTARLAKRIGLEPSHGGETALDLRGKLYRIRAQKRTPAGFRRGSGRIDLIEGWLGVHFHHVGGLPTPLSVDRLEFHDLSFDEGPEAFRLDRRVVDEELLPRILTDEPVPLGVAEPLDRAAVFQMRGPSFRPGLVIVRNGRDA